MVYCEVWLGSRTTKGENGDQKREYRVEFAAPPEITPPPGYLLVEEKQSQTEKKIFSSTWLPSIEAAKEELAKTADFCQKNDIKIMIFFEIR